MRLHGRNVTDTSERRVVNRVVDGVIVKELVRFVHHACCYLAQLPDYPPDLFGIVGKKLLDRIRQGQFSRFCLNDSREGGQGAESFVK